MDTPNATDITEILHSWSAGKPEAREELFPLVYDELRRLARSYLRKERADHTLQPPALTRGLLLHFTGHSIKICSGQINLNEIAERKIWLKIISIITIYS